MLVDFALIMLCFRHEAKFISFYSQKHHSCDGFDSQLFSCCLISDLVTDKFSQPCL